jgi:hypothetical protein
MRLIASGWGIESLPTHSREDTPFLKLFFVVISWIIISSAALAQQPPWELISDQGMSSFDMLTTRTGLLGFDDNRVHILSLYNNDTITGMFSASGTINSIIIVDAYTAYFAVAGDGIYTATSGWSNFTKLASVQSPTLFAVRGTNILANFGTDLNVSSDGINFQSVNGISQKDTVTGAEFFSDQTVVAVTGRKLYRSLDGGRNWFVVLDTLHQANSIYIDRTNAAIYIGGAHCLKSSDSGKTWLTLTSVPFAPLAGPVIGARDCSGAFYIGPDGLTHQSMFRSIDQGRFFQQTGPALFFSSRMIKGAVFDRGSTFFWLDSSGFLGVARDGLDSVITDSVSDRVVVQADSGITNSLCPNAPATQFGVSVSFDQCTGIVLDSLKQIITAKSFGATFIPSPVTDTTSIRIAFTYHATHTGWDTAHYRLKFHSPVTGNIEQKFFDVIGRGTPGSPELSLTSNELDFPPTGLDSLHTLNITISNPGCDVLVIDTMYTTNPAIFILPPKVFPLTFAPGKSTLLTISFNPHLPGEYLETFVLQTNVGSRNITLRGTARSKGTDDVSFNLNDNIQIYPNPANNFLYIRWGDEIQNQSHSIILRDELGAEILRPQGGEEQIFTCDLHGLADGFYILDFGNGNFRRFIIRH